MNVKWYFLRATLQSAAPLIIDSGEGDALVDTNPVRDANGLPMLPASTLAGALRAAVGEKADQWFGCQNRDKSTRSEVIVTDGLFHWSDDQPRDGLLLLEADVNKMISDDVCSHVLPGRRTLTREHVRLNEYGVVDGAGKFSRDAIPTGSRFTFELRTKDLDAVDALTKAVARGLFLGGATRSGYGELTCISLGYEAVCLPQNWDRWCKIMGEGLQTSRHIKMALPKPDKDGCPTWTIEGRIEGPLLIGADARNEHEGRAPWREPQFHWSGCRGDLEPDVFVIPGSAIKGPVRHRTLYHLRRNKEGDAEESEAALFGTAAKDVSGAAGLLRFHDCAVPRETQIVTQTHVGLDRFTGGSRRGVLFTDASLWQPNLALRITELCPDQITSVQRKALQAALDDLAKGLLGLGAEWGEGAGVFHDAIVTPPSHLEENVNAA